MTTEEWNDLYRKLEKVCENLEKVKGLPMEELDELCKAVDSAQHYTEEYRGLAEPESLIMENKYAELSEAAFKKACKDRCLSSTGVTFTKGANMTTITVEPQKARVLIGWGQEYQKALTEKDLKR